MMYLFISVLGIYFGLFSVFHYWLLGAPKYVLIFGCVMLVMGVFMCYKVINAPVCWNTIGGRVCEHSEVIR